MTQPSHDPYAPHDPDVVEANTQNAEADEVVVPKGTSPEVLQWVGSDKERAHLALDAEHATSKPRKGLIEELEEIISQ